MSPAGPALALLVPCYNAARYLPRLMATVRAQTQPFAEILCYDDGSTDDTVQVARDLGLEIIVGDKNHGPAFARNRLADAARSPWIHFHDADDLLIPHYVERICPLLDESIDAAVCQTDWLLETTREVVIAWRYDGAALTADPVAANLRYPISVGACAFRRALFQQIGGFDQTFRTWEDGDLQVRFAHAGGRYHVHSEVLAISLRHDEGASAVRGGDLTLEDRTRLFENYLKTLDARHHPVVAEEAEKHAAWLLAENRRLDLADRDLAVCRTVGWRVPSTNNPLLRLVRPFVSARWLLLQQARVRRLGQK